mgnify:CR=1 FL=1
MSHALESITARRVAAASQPGARRQPAGIAGRQSIFRRARRRSAEPSENSWCARSTTRRDVEARTEMMFAATQAGIAFNAAGCHLPHGLSYPRVGPDAGLSPRQAIRPAKRWCRTAWRWCSTIPRSGATPRRARRSAICTARPASVPRRATRGRRTRAKRCRAGDRDDAGDRHAERACRPGLHLRRRRRAGDRIRAAVPGHPQTRPRRSRATT